MPLHEAGYAPGITARLEQQLNTLHTVYIGSKASIRPTTLVSYVSGPAARRRSYRAPIRKHPQKDIEKEKSKKEGLYIQQLLIEPILLIYHDPRFLHDKHDGNSRSETVLPFPIVQGASHGAPPLFAILFSTLRKC
jgi:hypothetical protein